MCLHQCQLLGGFSDSQSWAQQSEIKKQNQKKLGRRQSERRVLREAAETRGLGGSSVEAPADWGAVCSVPEPEDPASPPASCPSAPSLREQHSTARWRPEWLTTTPPLTSQVNLPGRCTPGPIPRPGTDYSLPPSFWTTEAAELQLCLESRV